MWGRKSRRRAKALPGRDKRLLKQRLAVHRSSRFCCSSLVFQRLARSRPRDNLLGTYHVQLQPSLTHRSCSRRQTLPILVSKLPLILAKSNSFSPNRMIAVMLNKSLSRTARREHQKVNFSKRGCLLEEWNISWRNRSTRQRSTNASWRRATSESERNEQKSRWSIHLFLFFLVVVKSFSPHPIAFSRKKGKFFPSREALRLTSSLSLVEFSKLRDPSPAREERTRQCCAESHWKLALLGQFQRGLPITKSFQEPRAHRVLGWNEDSTSNTGLSEATLYWKVSTVIWIWRRYWMMFFLLHHEHRRSTRKRPDLKLLFLRDKKIVLFLSRGYCANFERKNTCPRTGE